MSIVTYSRLPQIDKNIGLVLTDNGYIELNNSPFLRQFVTVLKEATKGPYTELYNIASNIDIGRASGEYLDRWGRFLSQSRTTISYASDLTLNNVEIYIYGESGNPTAAEVTNDAGDISIPSGTTVSGDDGSYTFRLIDNVKILGNKNSVFVRVMSENEGSIYVPGNYLSSVSLNMNEISNVMPLAVTRYKLKSRNTREISGGTSSADDSVYRYMLQESAASIGLSNDRRLNTLYDIEDVYDIKTRKFRGGVSVFIDATDSEKTDLVVQTARNFVRTMNFGMPVYCFPPVIKNFKPVLSLVVKTKDMLGNNFEDFKTSLSTKINSLKMGSAIQIQSILDEIISVTPGILSGSMKEGSVGGRQVLGKSIDLLFNERIYTAVTDITVVAVA